MGVSSPSGLHRGAMAFNVPTLMGDPRLELGTSQMGYIYNNLWQIHTELLIRPANSR